MQGITDEDIKWLLELLAREPLAEIEVAVGEDRVLLKKGIPVPVRDTPPKEANEKSPAALLQGPERATAPAVKWEAIRAPMAGVFYRRPSPEAPPYVEVGDEVHIGDTIGLIEAMKLYNEVTSHVRGRIMQFVVEDAQHVEADEVLIYVEPLYAHQ